MTLMWRMSSAAMLGNATAAAVLLLEINHSGSKPEHQCIAAWYALAVAIMTGIAVTFDTIITDHQPLTQWRKYALWSAALWCLGAAFGCVFLTAKSQRSAWEPDGLAMTHELALAQMLLSLVSCPPPISAQQQQQWEQHPHRQ